MQRARLEGERRDGHRVLEQAAEVGVVAVARAGRAPEVGAELLVAQERVEQTAQVRVVHLAGQMLEKPVELLDVAVGDRQELGGVGRVLLGTPDRGELDLQLVAKALDTAADAYEVAALELAGKEVGVSERAARDRAGAVAQLDRQVGAAVALGQPILARAREHALDLTPGTQLGHRHRRPS